jgi:hypothetical protein
MCKNNSFFNDIPKEKTLNYQIIAPKIRNLMEFYINKTDRSFPYNIIQNNNARGMFLTFANVAKNTYKTIIFLCDTMSQDPTRKIEYSISSIPLLRVVLEEIFTMVFFLDDLDNRVNTYHKSGWRESKIYYDRCVKSYGKNKDWKEWFTKFRLHLEETKKKFGITEREASNPKKNLPHWPTPGKMKKRIQSPDLKDFMQYLEDWFYADFSQASHLSWPGLAMMGAPFLRTNINKKEGLLRKSRSNCAFYATTLIFAFFSELDNLLAFNNKEELKYLWTLVSEYWMITKELYEKRYKSLLQ